jgi:hypothetical protein
LRARRQDRREVRDEPAPFDSADEDDCVYRGNVPGVPSRYIRSFDAIQRGDKVILCCRVSGWTQDHHGNLDDMEASLRESAEARGAIVVDTVRHVGSGSDPYWLFQAARKARETRAKLLAESTNRFIRHPRYHSKERPDLQARDCDLRWLASTTSGVELVTVLDPDATPAEERAIETRRGQSLKCRKGGRPIKGRHRFRAKWLPYAEQLSTDGLSLRQIADAIRRGFNRPVSHEAIRKALSTLRQQAESKDKQKTRESQRFSPFSSAKPSQRKR